MDGTVNKKQKKVKKSQEWKKKGGKLIPKTIVSEKDGTELFGFTAKPQGSNLMIMIDIYDEEKREETINRFRESCDELIEGYAKEGIFIKRVCLIDSNQIIPELNECTVIRDENNVVIRQDIAIDMIDLITGDLVPFEMTIGIRD